MVFFTTPELLEIGGLPFVSPYEKPTRHEALSYYRRVVDTFQLDLALLRERHDPSRNGLTGSSPSRRSRRTNRPRTRVARSSRARHRRVRLPEPARRSGRRFAARLALLPRAAPATTAARVVIVGGKNSAAEAALDLYRSGAAK